MASIYSCKECGANLSLNTIDLFPPDYYFDAGNKNTLSFARVDPSKLRFEKEDKIRPFFESLNYWGIQRNRTVIKCNACGRVVGHVYDDGDPLMDGHGQLGFGPSQVIPRVSRNEHVQIKGVLGSHSQATSLDDKVDWLQIKIQISNFS